MSTVVAKTLILIPAYNEAESVGQVIDDIRREMSALNAQTDILVIDDGSTDETASLVKARGVDVIRLPFNGGIGVALQTGFKFALESGYQAIVRLDADGQHPARFIKDILHPVLSGKVDLCIGSRFMSSGGYQSSAMRRLGIVWFSTLIRLLFRIRISDPTSGFQAMNRNLITLYSKRYASDYPEVEALLNLLRKGFTVQEVPITMNERKGGRSSIDWFRSIYYAVKVTTIVLLALLKR
ncbi:glycosyltransferase family 2 protein [Candidatus Poribacteria bacterium]|nr:glycosyltransferase family 2 protein [Candidatus Poribacteria bacterium]